MLFSFLSCEDEPEPDFVTVGKVPIYQDLSNTVIAFSDAQSYETLGKIVYLHPYIYINEEFKGIHVIDNTNPENPEKVAFFNIPGNTDFTIKGNFIYANHVLDFVTIEVSEEELIVTDRKENFYSNEDLNGVLHPGNDYFGFFECVDLSKGLVIGWKDEMITNPKCQR